MASVKIFDNHFSGHGKLFGANGLANVVRGMAQDAARIKLDIAGVTDMTDNTTGTAAASVVALSLPPQFDATSVDGAPTAGFNTAANKLEDAFAAMADSMNDVRVRLGLKLLSWTTGSIATRHTIPALDLTLTGDTGANAVDFATGRNRVSLLRDNVSLLTYALNEVATALGEPTTLGNIGGTVDRSGLVLKAVSDATGGTGSPAGTTSIADTVMDTFLTAIAANMATIAAEWSRIVGDPSTTDLTDNSGGVVSNTIADVSPTLVGYQDVATDSAPQVGLNAEMNKLDNNFADLTAQVNILLARYDIGLLTDSSGGSADATLEVIDDDLTEVDGTGSNSAPVAGTQAIFDAIAANIASLTAKVNLLVPFFGVEALTDNSGATAAETIVATAAIGAGVDNGAAATGLEGAVVDGFLSDVQNAQASLAGKLNEMTGSGVPTKALHVVAG